MRTWTKTFIFTVLRASLLALIFILHLVSFTFTLTAIEAGSASSMFEPAIICINAVALSTVAGFIVHKAIEYLKNKPRFNVSLIRTRSILTFLSLVITSSATFVLFLLRNRKNALIRDLSFLAHPAAASVILIVLSGIATLLAGVGAVISYYGCIQEEIGPSHFRRTGPAIGIRLYNLDGAESGLPSHTSIHHDRKVDTYTKFNSDRWTNVPL